MRRGGSSVGRCSLSTWNAAKRGAQTAAFSGLLCVMVVLDTAQAGDLSRADAPASVPVTLTTTCRLPGVASAARCGSLRRPLDPSQPGGVQIDIHFAVLPALARHKAADAVFFLAGGPGQSAISLAGALAAQQGRLGQRRDLVFVDQRGTGRSAPLRCADDAPRAGLRPLSEQADAGQRAASLRACRLALQALPYGDLRQFTTELAMADVDAVRQALGVPRINLIAASYGTRAALSLMRQFPATVRRAVLDGVAPPDMGLHQSAALDNQATLHALFQACTAEPACQQRYPQLRAQWQATLDRLPASVTVPHPVSGQPQTLWLTPDAAMAWLRAPLYAPALAAALPAALTQAFAGRWAALAALGSAAGGGEAGRIATGLHLSVVCAEDLAPNRPEVSSSADPDIATTTFPGAGPGDSLARFYREACADWPRGPVSAAFFTLPPTSSPTWLISGGLDPVTPPRHGQRVAAALGPLARHIVVANAGHGVLGQACLRDAVARFIASDDSDAAVLAMPADCAQTVPRPLAFVPPGLRADLPSSAVPTPASASTASGPRR